MMLDFYTEYFYQDYLRRRLVGCPVDFDVRARDSAQGYMKTLSHDEVVTCGNILDVVTQTGCSSQRKEDLLKSVFSLMKVDDESWKLEDLCALWRNVRSEHDCAAAAVILTPPRASSRRVTIMSPEEKATSYDVFGPQNLLDCFFNEEGCDGYEHYLRTQVRR